MLFTKNLEQIVFNRHNLLETDELIILSGYLGPSPVEKLKTLPFSTKVIYGMYGSEGIKPVLHSSLKSIQENTPDTLNIFYSKIPVHSKCYVWKRNNKIVHALIGSANFSTNGLTTPFREVLAETTLDTFDPLDDYVRYVLDNCISCLEGEVKKVSTQISISPDKCLLSLLGRGGEIQNAAGLNWGQNPNNHTNVNDAYIPIRTIDIKTFPNLFPPKQLTPIENEEGGRPHRHNDSIDIIWDDGFTMTGLLEGSQEIEGVVYPKQISSFPNKSDMGIYLRDRLGVPRGQPVRKYHLESYGRQDVEISILGDGVYGFDFSKTNNF